MQPMLVLRGEIGGGLSRLGAAERDNLLCNTTSRTALEEKLLIGISPVCSMDNAFVLHPASLGHTTSNGPLAVLTDAILNCLSPSHNLDDSCYVDDFIFVYYNEYHGKRVRVDGGCTECARHAPRPRSSRPSRMKF